MGGRLSRRRPEVQAYPGQKSRTWLKTELFVTGIINYMIYNINRCCYIDIIIYIVDAVHSTEK